MALGCSMRFPAGDMIVEMGPFSRDEALGFLPGLQRMSVVQYISFHNAQTVETEQEWYDGMIKKKDSLVWGLWVIENGERTLIGNSSLTDITQKHIIQATSGSVITNTSYWGRGIASAAHKARAWYAFEKYGMMRIKSAVLQGNDRSFRALQKNGYSYVYTERNEQFIDGKLRHLDCFECLNPSDWAWNIWWGEDESTKEARAARELTRAALAWAEENVELL